MTDDVQHRKACAQAADAIARIPATHAPQTLVGFDGFIDYIIDVVETRQDAETYRPFATISDFAARIAAAAGHSANLEMVVKLVKLGGNGPIMANALLQTGHRMTYAGVVGHGVVNPVFADMAARAQAVHLMGEPAVTEALEFRDGKLMLGRPSPLTAITFDNLRRLLGAGLERLLRESDGIATVNWTMTLEMTTLWRRLAAEVLPGLRSDRPWWFVDLADPAKRTREDLLAALDALRDVQRHARVVLGLNGSEGRQVLTALGGTWSGDGEDTASAVACAQAIREKLGIECVMVHLVRSAACALPGGAVGSGGFFEPRPLITTGAGDHFNAGFLAGILAGLPPATCLLMGGASSGFYVRTGRSPARSDLVGFLRQAAG